MWSGDVSGSFPPPSPELLSTESGLLCLPPSVAFAAVCVAVPACLGAVIERRGGLPIPGAGVIALLCWCVVDGRDVALSCAGLNDVGLHGLGVGMPTSGAEWLGPSDGKRMGLAVGEPLVAGLRLLSPCCFAAPPPPPPTWLLTPLLSYRVVLGANSLSNAVDGLPKSALDDCEPGMSNPRAPAPPPKPKPTLSFESMATRMFVRDSTRDLGRDIYKSAPSTWCAIR